MIKKFDLDIKKHFIDPILESRFGDLKFCVFEKDEDEQNILQMLSLCVSDALQYLDDPCDIEKITQWVFDQHRDIFCFDLMPLVIERLKDGGQLSSIGRFLTGFDATRLKNSTLVEEYTIEEIATIGFHHLIDHSDLLEYFKEFNSYYDSYLNNDLVKSEDERWKDLLMTAMTREEFFDHQIGHRDKVLVLVEELCGLSTENTVVLTSMFFEKNMDLNYYGTTERQERMVKLTQTLFSKPFSFDQLFDNELNKFGGVDLSSAGLHSKIDTTWHYIGFVLKNKQNDIDWMREAMGGSHFGWVAEAYFKKRPQLDNHALEHLLPLMNSFFEGGVVRQNLNDTLLGTEELATHQHQHQYKKGIRKI